MQLTECLENWCFGAQLIKLTVLHDAILKQHRVCEGCNLTNSATTGNETDVTFHFKEVGEF